MADGKRSGLASGTNGAPQMSLENEELQATSTENEKRIADRSEKTPIFSPTGHVTLESISLRREFFLGKSAAKIDHILKRNGYTTTRRNSVHSTSKAKAIVITNSSKQRNIKQVLVSPGSKRHGDVPYVKISTFDYGRIKIIGTEKENYKTDGKEKAVLLFRRKRK